MTICVFGASSNTIDPQYISTVEHLGECLAERGHTLVFGGGGAGLMGAVVRGVSRKGGKSIGIAPNFLNIKNVISEACTEYIFTETMAERKSKMEDLADAFLIVPGGVGTYEEFFEVLTLKQLKQHNKPIVILNLLHYYDMMEALLGHTASSGFLQKENQKLYHITKEPEDALRYIETYNEALPSVSKYGSEADCS